jgi:hypothetical protein
MTCRISLDWSYRGMRTIVMENSLIRIVSLLDKGSDIIELLYKPLDLNLMWQSPTGWRNPLKEASANPVTHGGFLDYYGGGWQDIAPSAGGHSVVYRGAELGIHGESAMLRWGCVVEEESSERVSAYMYVDGVRYPFRLEKHISIYDGEATVYFREKLINKAKQTLEFSWLQHPSFGEPFLEPGCKIELPQGSRVLVQDESYNPYGRIKPGEYEWPMVAGRDGGMIDLSIIPDRDLVAEETSFITDMAEGRYTILNPKIGLGFRMVWDRSIFRYLWFWQNYNTPDYRWYGEAWNIALEPCTSYPAGLPDQVREGTTLTIEGRRYLETSFKAEILDMRREERFNARNISP